MRCPAVKLRANKAGVRCSAESGQPSISQPALSTFGLPLPLGRTGRSSFHWKPQGNAAPPPGLGPGFLACIGTGVMQGIPSLPYYLCCKEGGHSKILFLGVLGQLDPCSVLTAPKNGAEDHLLGLILGLQILPMSL